MSVMEKVFGAIGFGGGNTNVPAVTPAPAQGQQVTPQNLPVSPAQTATPGSGTVPSNSGNAPENTASNTEAVKSPLDQFTDLWKNEPNKQGENNQQTFNIDQTKLMEAASKVDFARVITPEQLTAISGGGEGAIKAFSESMNKIAQTVYAQSAVASTEIVKQAISQAETKFVAQIPNLVKKHQMSDGLRTDNPAFSHPAAQPIISALEAQLTSKHPNATSSELRTLATSYLSSFAEATNPAKVLDTTNTTSKGETDWSKFLES